MKHSRRWQRNTAGVALAVLTVGLAACNNSEKKPVAAPSKPSTTSASSGSSSAPDATSTSSGTSAPVTESSNALAEPESPITITAQSYYGDEPAKSQWMTTLNNCGKPHQITIKHVTVPGDKLIAKILQQGQTKTLPDLEMIDNPETQQIAKAGLLNPLSHFGLNAEGILPQVVAANTYEGELYGAQPITNTLAIFYNKDLLDKAGVTPPKTWDELKAAATKLTSGGTYGLAFSAKADYEGTWQFLPFFWSAGAELDKIDSPEAVSALELVKGLVDSKAASKSVVTWSQGDVVDQFIGGKAAMMLNGPWNFPALKAAKGLNWDVSTVPVAKEGAPSGAPLGGETWTVPKTGKTDNEKAAAKIIACLMSDENQLAIANSNGLIPTRESLLEQFAAGADPQMKGFVEQIKTARARTGVVGVRYPEYAVALYKSLGDALAGGKSPQAALTAAAATVK